MLVGEVVNRKKASEGRLLKVDIDDANGNTVFLCFVCLDSFEEGTWV